MADWVLDLIDAELARLEADDLSDAAWFEWRNKAWRRGVKVAREVSAKELRKIRAAYISGERRAGGDRRKEGR